MPAYRFHVLKFLNSYKIPYTEKSPNTAKGNINIHCPWCGNDDPSMHLGIRVTSEGLYNGAYGCWRHQSHRGKNPARLVASLLGSTYAQANEIIGDVRPDLGTVDGVIASLRGETQPNRTKSAETLKLPSSFRRINDGRFSLKYMEYLIDRGFRNPLLKRFIKRYDLRYSLTGAYKGRIIIPVTVDGELVTWTSRDVTGHAEVRYKTLSHKTVREGEPLAVLNIKDTIYNYDFLEGGKTLYIVEGPFDCFKIDFFGYRYGINATGLYSNSPTDEQIYLLNQVAERYEKVFCLLDDTEFSNSIRLLRRLNHPMAGRASLEGKRKDPGDLSEVEVKNFLANVDTLA